MFNFLSDVDGDEISLVKRAANKRRFLMLKGDDGLDAELADILDIPWEREGALLDQIRKEGIQDDAVERAVVAGIRLLKGVETELTPELIEKLGTELYGKSNPALNTSSGSSGGGDLTGSAGSGEDDHYGSASGADKDGSAGGTDLEGGGSAPKVAADGHPADCDCPDCQEDMEKAEFSDSERKDLASRGQAQSDGSYPIRNKSDLGNAIQAFGRSKNKSATKSWIIRRAKALGATGMLPDSWGVSKSDSSDNDDVMSDIEKGDAVEFRVPVKKEDGTWDYEGVPDEAVGFFSTLIEKSEQTSKELAEAREQISKNADDNLHRDAVEKAASYSHVAPTDDLAPILKEASEKLEPETVEKLQELLGNAEERIAKGDLFTEMGKRTSVETSSSDAYTEAVKKSTELIEKSDTALTQDQAMSRVWMENPDLYAQYLSENGMGVA
jgi:hypothetical protein